MSKENLCDYVNKSKFETCIQAFNDFINQSNLKDKFVSFVKDDSSDKTVTSLKEKIENDLKEDTNDDIDINFKENVQIEKSEKDTCIKEEIINKLLDDQNHI